MNFLEMFGCQTLEEMTKGMDNASLHSVGEGSVRSSAKGRKEGKTPLPLAEEYLAEKENLHLSPMRDDRVSSSRENDVDKFSAKNSNKYPADTAEQQTAPGPPTAAGNGSGNSSSQPSPSHRASAMSDPLPEACHVSPRVSAISDPLSEVCGTSECSETGYAESIRSSEGLVGGPRRWRGGGVSGMSGSALDDSGITPEQESLEQQVTMLKLRLEEATKTVQAERE